MKNTKSQVTLFVILGLVFIIVVGIAMYIVFLSNKTPSNDFKENYPAELQPLKLQVEQCLQQVAKEGFIIAGQHGGYVYPERAGIIPLQGRETSSSGLYFAPGSNLTIPYWYYMSSGDSCKSCQFKSKRIALNKKPGVPSVESEVQTYIEEHIASCINNDEFTKRGYTITPVQGPSALVSIGKEDVTLMLTYPLEIKKNNIISRMGTFQQKLNLNFKRIFTMATAIAQDWEITDFKALERATVQLINAYSLEGGSFNLPPVSGPTTFGIKAPKTWLLSDVKTSMKSMLTQNVPRIQVDGSQDFTLYRSENKFSDSFYNDLIYPVKSADRKDLGMIHADITYLPWWDIYLKVTPSKGGLIMPQAPFTLNLIFFTFSMQSYNFNYDLSYPVVITLKDPQAFNGEGYTFQYGLEVNVRNTQPMNTSMINLTQADSQDDSLFSHDVQRVSYLTAKTQNGVTNEPVDDVLLTYNCAQDDILLGQTALANNEAVLATKIPPCFGGIIQATLNGYTSEPYPLSLKENESANIVINMYPIVVKNLIIKKRMMDKQQVTAGGGFLSIPMWFFKNDSEEDLAIDEQAIVVLERKSDYGNEFVRIANFMGNESLNQNIELTVGQYKVDGYIMRLFGENRSLEKFVIPAKHACEGGGLFSSETCYDIPAIEFNSSFFIGGVTLDNTTIGYFNITPEDLGKNTLTVYMVAVNPAQMTDVEDLDQLGKVDEYTLLAPEKMMPVFS